MERNEKQYERVARAIDGRDEVETSKTSENPDDQALIEEFQTDWSLVSGLLEVPLPPAAYQRARRRMLAATLLPKTRWGRIAGLWAAGLASAAMILLTFNWFWDPAPPPGLISGSLTHVPSRVLFQSTGEENGEFEMELMLLGAEIDRQGAELASGGDSLPVEGGIHDLQNGIDSFWEIDDDFSLFFEG